MDCRFGLPSNVTLAPRAWLTRLVPQILSCGYGLSFWPVPTVAAIGTLVSADMGDPTGYIWFVPVRYLSRLLTFID